MTKKALLWTFLVVLMAGLSVSMYFLITKVRVSATECDVSRICYVLDSEGEKVESETITEQNFKKVVYSKNFNEEVLAELEKVGYAFSGWFGSEEFKEENKLTTQTKFNEKTVSLNKKEKSATIYAYFTPNTYSKMLYTSPDIKSNYGHQVFKASKSEVVYGQTIGELVESQNLKASTVSGKVFYAWYADKDYTQKLDNESKLTFDNVRFDPIMNTFMIYAKYIDESCTLVYKNTDLANATLNYGAQLNLTTPTKAGYDFDGWYFDKELKNKITDENQVLNNAVEFDGTNFYVYAKWTPKTITLTFNANGGVCNKTSKEFTVGEVYGTLPTATKDNFKFAGWFTNINDVTTKITSESVVSFTEDSTISAKFVAENMRAFTVKKSDNVNYNIFYSTDGGLNWSNLHNDTTNTANELTYYIQNGYMWKIETTTNATYFNLNCEATQTGTAEEDKVVELKATGKQFKLVLNTNNETTGNSEKTKAYGASLADSLPNLKKSGFVFDGWYNDASFTTKLNAQDVLSVSTATFITGEETTANIYAKWTQKQVKVNKVIIGSITREWNGGAEFRLKSGDTILDSLTELNNGIYELEASYSNKALNDYRSTGITIEITDETKVVNVYVYYCPLYISVEEGEQGIAYYMSSVEDETEADPSKYVGYLKGQQFEIEVEVNLGYHFTNWTWVDGSNDHGVISTTNPITYEINRRMKIWPHTAKNVYNIEFNTNGGDEIALATREYLSTLGDEPLPVPTRGGCVFLGWFADSNFTKPVTNATTIDNTTFAEEKLINNNSTLTLYAKWLENEVVVNPKRVASSDVGIPASYIEVKLYDEDNNKFIEPNQKEQGKITFNAVPVGTYKIYASSKYNNANISSIIDNTGVEAELVDSRETITVSEPTVSGEEINNNPSPVQIDYYPLYLRGNDDDNESDAESTGITSVNQNKVRYLKGQTTTISAEVAFGYNFDGWYNKSGDTLKYSEIECSITVNAKTTLKAMATAKTYTIVYHNGATENEKIKTYGTSFASGDLKAASGNGVFKGWSTNKNSIADEYIIEEGDIFNNLNLSDFDGEKFHIYAAFVTQCEIKNAEGTVLTTIGYNETKTTLLVPQKVNKTGYNFLGFKLNEGDSDLLATNAGLTNGSYSCALKANVTNITNTNKEWIYFAKEYITLYPVYEAKTTIITVKDASNNDYAILKLTYDSGTVMLNSGNTQYTGNEDYNFVYQENGTTTTSVLINKSGELQLVSGLTQQVDGNIVWAYEGETLTLITQA